MTNNGKGKSTEVLAKALKSVFEEAVAPLRGDIEDLRGEMNERFDTTNNNTQVQISQARKGFSTALKNGLSKIK